DRIAEGDSQRAGFLIQDVGWGWGPASMARPYSKDLRDRVVSSVAGGRSCRATAALFGVSVASVVKWSQRYRATGSAAAYRMGGRRPRRLTGERDWPLARIAEKPDLPLRAGVAELAARGLAARYGAVWRFFAREGVTRTKEPAPRRGRPRRRRPPPAPSCSSCRPTPPTSTRSSRSSPSSRPCCAKPTSERARPPGNGSAPCSTTSHRRNAPTTSSTLAMLRLKRIAL